MKLTSIRKLVALATIGAAVSASAQGEYVELTNAVLTQSTQSRIVEVSYELTNDAPVYVTLGITVDGAPIPDPVTVWGAVTSEQSPTPVAPGGGVRKIHWDARQDWPGVLTTGAQAVVTAWFTNAPPASLSYYVVVDLSEGPGADVYPHRYSVTPPVLSDPACKTTELWLRRIPAGTFMMGSPDEELGENRGQEDMHEVTLTKDFYIGVFEVTQKQYALVTGTDPSTYKGDMRPVEMVSYTNIRGAALGADWPASDAVDPTSFMGRLRNKTPFRFDLPTEAQWEYACRAGTTTALNSGKNLTVTSGTCVNVNEVARYLENRADGKGGYTLHTAVGLYLPNAWGLYDMHGNVWEWCLDRYTATLGSAAVTDPKGHQTNANRSYRGGGHNSPVDSCRSARRVDYVPNNTANSLGFRVCALTPPTP